jgi:hypothetical protein
MAGKLIVGMGLPGAGKSTVFAALAPLLLQDGSDVTLLREPEEDQWPAAVSDRERSGYFGALTWFRSQRVPNLFEAATARDRGGIALVDSYYDKLIHLYFEGPGMEWLMKPTDPYRPIYKELIALDHRNLPDADCVVAFVLEQERWIDLVRGRGRQLDRSARLLETFPTQTAFTRSAEQYCARKGIPCVRFDNAYPTALAAGMALRDQLRAVGVLSP